MPVMTPRQSNGIKQRPVEYKFQTKYDSEIFQPLGQVPKLAGVEDSLGKRPSWLLSDWGQIPGLKAERVGHGKAMGSSIGNMAAMRKRPGEARWRGSTRIPRKPACHNRRRHIPTKALSYLHSNAQLSSNPNHKYFRVSRNRAVLNHLNHKESIGKPKQRHMVTT
jgi:hypothetical protein